MLRVSLEQLEAGMVLARPIAMPAYPSRHILPRDAEVPADAVPQLKRLGIEEVWVRCDRLEFLEQLICDDLADAQKQLFSRVRSNFEQVMHRSTAELDLSGFQTSIADLFDLLERTTFGRALIERVDATDDLLMCHSTNVCYVALLVGMKLRKYLADERSHLPACEARDLSRLGLGCLLHDVGKLRIPPEILNKPGRLTREEFEIMKRHPSLGVEMLEGQADADTTDVVLNHHQRWDGRGYPELRDERTGERLPGMRGREISIFSRIATIADIYDAATSKRCYSDAKPAVQVLHELRTWCRGAFDPVVEQAFYEVIPPFSIGSIVKLSNGIEAVVVDFDPRRPVTPTVQCLRSPKGERFRDPGSEEIDLASYQGIDIVEINGVDVRRFLELQRSNPLCELDPAVRT